MNFRGVIIEESLADKKILEKIKILSTKVVPVTSRHKTPWVKQWTMHTVEVPVAQAREVAEALMHALDSKHNWYADFENDTRHFIIYPKKIFYVDRTHKEEYNEVSAYGVSIGIPDYQVDFSSHIKSQQG